MTRLVLLVTVLAAAASARPLVLAPVNGSPLAASTPRQIFTLVPVNSLGSQPFFFQQPQSVVPNGALGGSVILLSPAQLGQVQLGQTAGLQFGSVGQQVVVPPPTVVVPDAASVKTPAVAVVATAAAATATQAPATTTQAPVKATPTTVVAKPVVVPVQLPSKLVEVKEISDVPAKYVYKYDVSDPSTGDAKTASETRDGDRISGFYTVLDPDGFVRRVEYSADPEKGFQANVIRTPVASNAAVKPVDTPPAPAASKNPDARYNAQVSMGDSTWHWNSEDVQ